MNQRSSSIIFHLLLTVTLFSYWAGFALLVVNKLFYKDLPGYTIGRICIWELVAIIIAFLIAKWMIRKWGNIQVQRIGAEQKIIMNANYGIYFSVYFLIAILVGVWQFYLFSQKF